MESGLQRFQLNNVGCICFEKGKEKNDFTAENFPREISVCKSQFPHPEVSILSQITIPGAN